MNKKLTLTIDESVIDKAKDFAKKYGRSLSDLIESYLKEITCDGELEIPEEFKNLFGSIKIDRKLDDKEEIKSILYEKYMQ